MGLRIRLRNLTEDFDERRVITDSEPVDKNGIFTDGGIFSERIFGKMAATSKEYSCECGCTEGRYFEGTFCLSCDTEVVSRETSVARRGWIDLRSNRIISPIFHVYFSKVIGPSALARILEQKVVLTIDGRPRTDLPKDGPFDGLGHLGFAEQWEEILNTYERKRKSDKKVAAYAALIRDNADKIFISKIPVFSPVLRPAVMVGDQMIYNEINDDIKLMVEKAAIIDTLPEEEYTEHRVNAILWDLQEGANRVFDYVLNTLNGKSGWVRSNMLGQRVNFSSRCVITPLAPGFEQDAVVVPYLAFLELFRFQLTNVIARVQGVSLAAANEIWHKAQTKFDSGVFRIMKRMIEHSREGGLPALLNRNPTLAFGSLLLVRIVDVKRNLDDYTMSLHNSILKPLGGDYDGDVLALVPLLDRELVEAFRVFSPLRMYVSRDEPALNPSFRLDKDHVLGLHVLTEE